MKCEHFYRLEDVLLGFSFLGLLFLGVYIGIIASPKTENDFKDCVHYSNDVQKCYN